jgi:hypothetical protein
MINIDDNFRIKMVENMTALGELGESWFNNAFKILNHFHLKLALSIKIWVGMQSTQWNQCCLPQLPTSIRPPKTLTFTCKTQPSHL